VGSASRGRHRGTGRRGVLPPSRLALAWLLVLATAGTVAAVRSATSGSDPAEAAAQASDAGPEPSGDAGPGAGSAAPAEPPSAPPPAWEGFAEGLGVLVHLPAPDPILVAFHEAVKDDAVAMTPIGTLVRNANRRRYPGPPPDASGPDYVVMRTRHRDTPPTSAADVVYPAGTPMRAPVTGRVTGVRVYSLYGLVDDYRVAILPRGAPHVRVVMIHLTSLEVEKGDLVFATLSVLGRPRVLPFGSQVDDYQDEGEPHVHIEVKDVAATAPR
jgi:hypothetical protein